MEASDWIAIASVAIAAYAVLRTERLRLRVSVAFAVEHDGGPKFRVRHVGTRRLKDVRVERALGETQPETVLPPMPWMEPGESTDLYISPAGQCPDTIVIRWGKWGRRVIPFPCHE